MDDRTKPPSAYNEAVETERSSGNWRTLLAAGGFLGDVLSYALGYREAADVLVEQISQGHRYEALVYPICYCYRHCIELLLKIATKELLAAGTNEHRELLNGIDGTHNLERLCAKYRAALAIWDQALDAEGAEALMWFHRADPHAQTFRYAVGTNGARSFPRETMFDVNEVQQRAANAIEFLLGTIAWVDACRSAGPSEHEYTDTGEHGW